MASLRSAVGVAVAAGRFHRPPLGPLGCLLTLTDDAWAVAVEAAAGIALRAWITHDHHDQNLLRVRPGTKAVLL